MIKSDLKNMVTHIQHEEDDMEKEGLKLVLEALVKKQNGAVEIMAEIKEFLEDAIPRFVAKANEKNYWEQRIYNDKSRGCMNPYNCVIKYSTTDTDYYWVDDTVCAGIDRSSGIINVIYLVANYGYSNTSNYCGDWWRFDDSKFMAWTHQYAKQFGDNQIENVTKSVEKRVEYANNCLMKLELMLKKIADSVHKRHEERNALIDGASAKKRIVTITIEEND